MVAKFILLTTLNFIHYLFNGNLLNSVKSGLRPLNFYCYYLIFMYNKLARIYRMSLLYSTTLLNVTVIHSCPFCALNFIFIWQAIIVYFLLSLKHKTMLE